MMHSPAIPDPSREDRGEPQPAYGARLVLASASPRRQALLHEAGYEFEICPANVDEEAHGQQLLPAELARQLAMEKARVVAEQYPSDVVLGADTVVAFGDKPLGKPAGAEAARRMLKLLSGTTHIVITGVAIVCLERQFEKTQAVMSAVRMRVMTEREVERYVESGEWQGKAGGYGIQDRDPFVMRMSGSLSNIVGLPMEATRRMLGDAGIMPRRT